MATRAHPPVWQIQEAKDHLSEVIDHACTEGVQTITKHGKPVVMVVPVEEWHRMQDETSRPQRKTLVEIFRDPRVVGHLVIPERDGQPAGAPIDLDG